MSTLPASIPKAEIQKLDAIASEALATLGIGSAFERTFALAEAIDQLKTAITPAMMTRFMKLQNSKLGFKTDHDPKVWNKRENAYNKPYSEEVVKDCVIEAVLRGVQTVGNQFNIISAGCYITKEGFEYKLKQLPGLAKLKVNLGVPQTKAGGALVECDATWVLNGEADSMKATLACKGDDYAGADSYIGKASRKFLKRIYERCTGTSDPDGEADSENTQLSTPTAPAQLSNPRFGAAAAATTESAGAAASTAARPSAAPAQDDERAEAEAGLAPAAGTNGGAPAQPGLSLVSDSPQSKLEEFMTDAGVTFTKFRTWAGTTDRLKDADSFGTWAELPKAFCEELATDAKSLTKCVTLCKP